jgi:HSP20 family protein
MNALADIRSGFDHAMQSLTEGWHQLRRRAAHALTRFHPVTRSTNAPVNKMLEANASQWGLLAADIHEDKDHLTVRVEVPGMDAKDFDIQLIGESLVVSGEKHAQSERSEGRYQIMECAYGSFERVIPLTAAVDDQRAKAKYKHGVLTITLPKTNAVAKGRIKID